MHGAEVGARRVASRAATIWPSELRDTPGGRNLLEIGMDHDLVDCARIDTLAVVPELDIAAWRITVAIDARSPLPLK